MGGLKGKSTGNHRFSHEIWDFPVIFPLNQSIEPIALEELKTISQGAAASGTADIGGSVGKRPHARSALG